jgi:hypothetical protein
VKEWGWGTNRVYAQVALPNEKGQKLTGKQLLAILDKVCKDGTTVASDDFSGYGILDRKDVRQFIHVVVLYHYLTIALIPGG